MALTGLAGKDVSGPLSAGNADTFDRYRTSKRIPARFCSNQIQAIQSAQGLPVGVSPLVDCAGWYLNPTLIGGYGQTLRNLFGGDTRNVTVGVRSRSRSRTRLRKRISRAREFRRNSSQASTRSQEQIIEVDVRNSAQAVESSRQRVLSAREARVNAEMQLEGEQRLYQVGRSTTFLLFQRENALANARASELRAETDYNKAMADLQRATSTTLRANNVVVDTPLAAVNTQRHQGAQESTRSSKYHCAFCAFCASLVARSDEDQRHHHHIQRRIKYQSRMRVSRMGR